MNVTRRDSSFREAIRRIGFITLMVLGFNARAELTDYEFDLTCKNTNVDRRDYDSKGNFDCSYWFSEHPNKEYCGLELLVGCKGEDNNGSRN